MAKKAKPAKSKHVENKPVPGKPVPPPSRRRAKPAPSPKPKETFVENIAPEKRVDIKGMDAHEEEE